MDAGPIHRQRKWLPPRRRPTRGAGRTGRLSTHGRAGRYTVSGTPGTHYHGQRTGIPCQQPLRAGSTAGRASPDRRRSARLATSPARPGPRSQPWLSNVAPSHQTLGDLLQKLYQIRRLKKTRKRGDEGQASLAETRRELKKSLTRTRLRQLGARMQVGIEIETPFRERLVHFCKRGRAKGAGADKTYKGRKRCRGR